MRTRRRTLLATGLVALLTIAGITAAIANDPPPRIAFVANGIVPADALAAGPIAGQLGAPIYTTAPDFLVDSAAAALDAYNPELVIVMGGPAAISDAVLGQISEATGLSVVAPSPTPSSGIVRAAGEDRFQTAAAAAALLAAYDPAYLPTDMKAIDSDKLDGKDSTAFLGKTEKAADADKLDGKDSTAFLGVTQKATDSDKLDGKDSTAFMPSGAITTTHGGANWLPYQTPPSSVSRLITGTVVSGDGAMNISLDAPHSVGGVEYGLESIELCYTTSSGGSISSLWVFTSLSTFPYSDSTTRTSSGTSAYKCDTVAVNTPVQGGIGVYVTLAGGGSIRLGWVGATWTPQAAASTASSLSAVSENPAD